MDTRIRTWERYRDRIRDLESLEFNYDDSLKESFSEKFGWKIDCYRAEIASEPPGPPIPDGPFARARHVLANYAFPDPRLVEGWFQPEAALQGRNMLLRARFMGFTFHFGTRVNRVFDEIRHDPERGEYHVWGYSYRTLQGHFEMGEIKFEVCKYVRSGIVEFHINAYSKADRIPNPFYRAGFRIFGRSLQRYFASSSLKRMRTLIKTPVTREERWPTRSSTRSPS